MDKIYLLIGNDTPLAVCLRKSEGEGDPVPYDLSTAERMRLALVGHGMHVLAEDIEIFGEDDNIVSGVIPGRSLLKGDYDLEVTFNLDGRDKRFAINDMFEAVDFLAEDADGEAEGEGAGIFVTVTVQPELIEISGPTGPQGKSAYQVWLDDGHTGTEDDFFEWLAAQTPNPDWEQNDPSKADFIKNRTHWEEESSTTINDAKLAWSGSTPETLDFWLFGSDVHIPRTSTGWGLTWEGGELFIDDMGSGYEIGVFDGEEWEYNPFDPSFDQQPYPLGVDVVIASETVHKLPNKFLDMDTEPTTGSGKPVTSGGVKAAIADFVTRAVNDLLNYYTKTETYTKAEVNQLVAGINNWEIVPVAQLPEASADTMHKIYLVPSSNPKTRNVKDEFITVEVSGAYSWEQIGTTAIDLTNYVTRQELNTALADYVTSTAFTQALALKQDVIEDLPAIRQGASLGATAYQKPANGIPADDLEEGVIPDTSKLAEKDGYYPEMSVGSLVGTEVTQVEGITTIAKSTGIAKINEVMGKSLVWNQLNPSLESGNWQPYDNSSLALSFNDGVMRATLLTTSASPTANRPITTLYNGNLFHHKVFLKAIVKPSVNSDVRLFFYGRNKDGVSYGKSNFTVFECSANTRQELSAIYDLSSVAGGDAVGGFCTVSISGDAVVADSYIDIYALQLIDLTQLFTSGNEPFTVAEFESWLANNIGYRDYYAYNPGEIISNNTEALEITGLNHWDGEYSESGLKYLTSNGAIVALSSYKVSSYIPVIPGTSYYLKDMVASNADAPGLCWYDSEKNYISGVNSNIYLYNKVIVAPAGAYFMRCSVYQNTVDTACVSVSGSRDGEYEPYQKSELELNLATITGKLNGEGESVTIFPEGMKSAGTAYDSLIVDEDGWCRRAVRRMTVGLMENFSWRLYGQMSGINCWVVDNLGLKGGNNILSVKYPTSTSIVDKTIRNQVAIGTGTLWCYDNSYSTVTEFKAGLVGQKLIYPLSTPQEYVLDTPIQMTFQAKHGGVIRQLPENGSEPTTAPMRMSVTYALDAVSILTDLPENYVSKESLQAMLSAMQSAGLFSAYTMTFNESTGKYEFTFTANA